MDNLGKIGSQNIEVIEHLYEEYQKNPEKVEVSWQHFFEGFELALTDYFQKGKKSDGCEQIDKEFKVLELIHNYRQRGHLFTQTNPVRTRRKYAPTLAIENFGLSADDLGTVFQAGNEIGIGPAPLHKIVEHLEATYCRSIGAEFIFIRKPELVQWLKQKMESTLNRMFFSPEMKRHVFYHLKLAVGFEQFIHQKFVGQKRFSLEGCETLIPALDAIIERGAQLGIKEFVIGMAHRGRLNVLANILEKPYENIFKEYHGTEYEEGISQGDVKYHLGYENEVTTDTGEKVKLSVLPNPSHLEAVSPVVQGMSRSRIDHDYNGDYNKLAPILIHGDAAIAAQGVVYEVTQMAGLKGYHTGGTIHVVINNQVGFTTNYLDARTSTYCTDVARVTRSPVFHVNGDDVESLIYAIKLVMEFRQRFHSDIFLDILSYRKYGHNEGDEPRFTQPLLYKAIAQHQNPRDIYTAKLIKEGVMSREEMDAEISAFNDLLEEKYNESQFLDKVKIRKFLVEDYKGYCLPGHGVCPKEVKTAVELERLQEIGRRITSLPGDQKFFRKIVKLMEHRAKIIEEGKIDWALGEQLAYGSLLNEGFPVRISGQDSERGTFSHRHAALVVEDTDQKYFPLKSIDENQAPFHIYNSLLSEYGVLGFEYGYALACPKGLTIWEAQFGDFNNVAQVIFDQYICSAGEKWGLMNGVVLMLPHGYEGQGPEHSSARMERILNLCANRNMQVVQCTTPANLFHILRRQVKWNFRIPLILFTPKSLLRHPAVVSDLTELSEGEFQAVIDDVAADSSKVERMVFTTGKLFFELKSQARERHENRIAFIRVEQLYPFPENDILRIANRYPKANEYYWVQDEPGNMGAWPFMVLNFDKLKLRLVARPVSASPAIGLMEQHKKREQKIMDQVFNF